MISSKSQAIKWAAPPSASHVLHLIRAERDVQKALQIFEAASREHSGYRHDHPNYALMASRLASSGHPRTAESLLSRAFSELGNPPEESSFLPIIRSYSSSHLPLDSLHLFRRMTTVFLLRPSHRSYNATLAALVANNQLSSAKTLFNEMKSAGIPFKVTSFNILIKALCSSSSSGSLEAAIRIFHRMPGRGCRPDACTYNTLIHGLCQNGRVNDARNLFDEMPKQKLSPTVVTFSSLIHGLCISGHLDDALNLFDEMSAQGIKPNVVTYTSLIDGLCKGGRSIEATKLLDQMGRRGFAPNIITYTALIVGLLRSEKLRESLEVFDGMRLRGRKPDAGLYGKIINALCDSGRFQEASNYLDEMVMSGVVPNRLTWSLHVRIHNMVIRGLCGTGEMIRAFRVYVSSRRRGILIEVETYGVLVELWCRKGEVEKAAGVVEEMVVDGCLPDSSVWCSVMEVLWGEREVEEEDELVWEELVCGGGDHEGVELWKKKNFVQTSRQHQENLKDIIVWMFGQ